MLRIKAREHAHLLGGLPRDIASRAPPSPQRGEGREGGRAEGTASRATEVPPARPLSLPPPPGAGDATSLCCSRKAHSGELRLPSPSLSPSPPPRMRTRVRNRNPLGASTATRSRRGWRRTRSMSRGFMRWAARRRSARCSRKRSVSGSPSPPTAKPARPPARRAKARAGPGARWRCCGLRVPAARWRAGRSRSRAGCSCAWPPRTCISQRCATARAKPPKRC